MMTPPSLRHKCARHLGRSAKLRRAADSLAGEDADQHGEREGCGLIDRPAPGNLTLNQQARVTAVTLAMEMDQKSGAFGQKLGKKLQENLSLAAGGAFPGDPLDNEQAFAVKCALKEAKEAETPGQLSIGVKAKIAGGIVANLSDMPPGAEKIGDALTAIDSLQF